MSYAFFANCPRLIEGLLLEELTQLGAQDCKETLTGVYFNASLETAYRICLWSRLANHVLLHLKTIEVTDLASIHRGVASINWSSHFTARQTLKIDFSGLTNLIQNTQYGSQLVKDAIVDQFRAKTGERPNVELVNPDIRIHAHLYGDKLNLSLDLSGESLHKRGYRGDSALDAPMKENLAAALLIRSGFAKNWQQYLYVIDPMCGTGTLLIEAALMVTDTAPGLLRRKFGFTHWLQHDAKLWDALVSEAIEREKLGLSRTLPDIRGYDGSPRAVSQARENIERAGLEDLIDVSVRELSHLVPPTHAGDKPGFLITNPPYGERLGETENLIPLYQHFGQRLREKFQHWEVALFLGDPDLGKVMGIRARKNYSFFNGTIACKLLLMTISPEWFIFAGAKNLSLLPELSPESEMFANRLRKNQKSLKSWVEKNNIHAYRVYDADMPEYSVAIDCYNDWAHVQEYAAPKTIDPQKAQDRLNQILNAIPSVLNIPSDHIVVKQRRQQKDHSQYEKFAAKNQYITVEEGACKLLVNLHDYLDTGLFLDHRPMRLHLASIASGKRFLNLFCYTGAVTVHAAIGGARSSVSVDMSTTYTNWAKRNLALNGLSDTLHRVIVADCLVWLENNNEKFDLIFLDPPTFSRSKRMDEDFDIQRDHVGLIRLCMQHLNRDGILYFSNNFRKFNLDTEALSDLEIKDITPKTIDKDFQRDPKIHHCFEIRCR
ncbi:MAG: bifunctional 23S rRNA (guanine(2069)-N(7))-methyltransferase RlmK/23S rRNA (guanine(2445)-N(2))-methyltransferase RlmL [Legionellales bacterium]|jgi:23S rRNA (guanine2445-N2)-methyltransferase / 23S rRNA (guanine2069-N7)-methyltransferase